MRLFVALAAAAALAAPSQAVPLTVFAASDLGPPFALVARQFERATSTRVTLVAGSTGHLAQQIRNGAPADVFFAADARFVDELSAESLTVRETRTLYARGRIVTVTLKSQGRKIATVGELARPDVRRVAIANPQHAPYGIAARQALKAAGVWLAIEPKLVYGENVQQAAQFVRSGSVDAGIVARSVAATPDLDWQLIDEILHTPLNQVAIVLLRSRYHDSAKSFIDYVIGKGAPTLRQFGFTVPGP